MNFRDDVDFQFAPNRLDLNVHDKGTRHPVCLSGDLALEVDDRRLPEIDGQRLVGN